MAMYIYFFVVAIWPNLVAVYTTAECVQAYD